MKTLIVYYSRTGTTKKIAEFLAEKLSVEIEEIKDTIDRSGVGGYLISGRDAMKRKTTILEPIAHSISEFDLIIIGTPIWSWNISVPIRTFIVEHKNDFKNVAFFCTMGGNGDRKAFDEMSEIIGKKPLSELSLKTTEIVRDNFPEKIDKFLEELNI